MQQNDTDRRTQDASAYGDPPRCYVITHERSGTHLTINLLIKNSTAELGWRSVGEWHGPFDQPFTAFDHIERFNRADQGPGVVAKTHCDRDLFEKIYKPAPVIYVMRDPRDVMVSWWKALNDPRYYRWAKGKIPSHACPSLSQFIRRPITPFLRWSYALRGSFINAIDRWVSHVCGWIDAPGVTVVRFESLLHDREATVRRIGESLQLPLKAEVAPVGLREMSAVMVRKGVVGEWRSFLNDGDERFIRRAVERGGLEWDRVVAPASCGK